MKEILEMLFRPLIEGWEFLWAKRTWLGRVLCVPIWIGTIVAQLLWIAIVVPSAILGFLYRTFQCLDKSTRKDVQHD